MCDFGLKPRLAGDSVMIRRAFNGWLGARHYNMSGTRNRHPYWLLHEICECDVFADSGVSANSAIWHRYGSDKAGSMASNEEVLEELQPSKKKGKRNREGKKVRERGAHLFDPITLRGLTIRNRIWLPPMDMYSVYERDGKPTPFHYQHYVSRGLGGFGLIMVEATAVSPEGRISPCDVGLWNDDQVEAWRWIVEGVRQTGASIGVQLGHAGRKGSTGCFSIGHIAQSVPLEEGGWQTVGATDVPYGRYAAPRALTTEEVRGIVSQFRDAAMRAVSAGFQAIELHGAHGYLLSQFMDPLINTREDEYGGSFDNRMRFPLEVIDAVREAISDTMPLMIRISATDWAAGGWDLDQSIDAAKLFKEHGVDLVDVSTGGIVSGVTVPVQPNYQVPFSAQIRQKAEVPVTAVGFITRPKQAQKITRNRQADAVQIGRAALRDPYWPLRAVHKLGIPVEKAPYADQYVRGAY